MKPAKLTPTIAATLTAATLTLTGCSSGGPYDNPSDEAIDSATREVNSVAIKLGEKPISPEFLEGISKKMVCDKLPDEPDADVYVPVMEDIVKTHKRSPETAAMILLSGTETWCEDKLDYIIRNDDL